MRAPGFEPWLVGDSTVHLTIPTTRWFTVCIFSEESILVCQTSFLSMNKNASPGPDDFGPGFYRKFWHILKDKIRNFFADFHALRSDISCLNRALIILLPKNNDARSPNDFRPIS